MHIINLWTMSWILSSFWNNFSGKLRIQDRRCNRVFCNGLLSWDASGMQTVCMHFSVVEVDSSFDCYGILIGIDLIDLIHWMVGPRHTDAGWLEISCVCRCHLSWSCPKSLLWFSFFFSCPVGTNKTRAIQKQLSWAIWNPATPSCCRSETNWSSVGRLYVM